MSANQPPEQLAPVDPQAVTETFTQGLQRRVGEACDALGGAAILPVFVIGSEYLFARTLVGMDHATAMAALVRDNTQLDTLIKFGTMATAGAITLKPSDLLSVGRTMLNGIRNFGITHPPSPNA